MTDGGAGDPRGGGTTGRGGPGPAGDDGTAGAGSGRSARSGGRRLRERSTFVALAGGDSRRMGRDKAFLEVGGREMLDRVLEAGRSACVGCVLVVGDPAPYADALRRYGWAEAGEEASDGPAGRFRRGGVGLRLITDRHPGLGPVAGLEAGLAAAPRPLCFVAACDLPFLPGRVVSALLAELARRVEAAGEDPGDGTGGARAVVPVADGRPQPLAAAYTAGCGAAARACVEARELSMEALLGRLDEVRTVPARRLTGPGEDGGTADPAGPFANVNRPGELRDARRRARSGGEAGAGGSA